MGRILSHPIYIGFIFFVIMPINGLIIGRGQVGLGLILMATQALWLFTSVISKIQK